MTSVYMLRPLLAAAAASFTPFAVRAPPGGVRRCARSVASVASIDGVTEELAQRQRDAYFSLMPSKELPTVSLDLRAWASKDDDNFDAGVFARQAGTVSLWKNVGTVATVDKGALTAAVAAQRGLIVRWAYELITDFETNRRIMTLDDGQPMIEIAWAVRPAKPGFFESLMGKEEDAIVYTEVPPDAAFDASLRCGFLGKLAREYRGGGVSARSDRIVIGKEPEVPLRAESQKKYDKKYVRQGAGSQGFIGQ